MPTRGLEHNPSPGFNADSAMEGIPLIGFGQGCGIFLNIGGAFRVEIPRSEVRKATASAMRNAGIAIDGHRVDRLDDALSCRRTPYPFEGRLEEIPQAYGDGVAGVDVAFPVYVCKSGPRLAAGELDTFPLPVRKNASQGTVEEEIVDDEPLPI